MRWERKRETDMESRESDSSERGGSENEQRDKE